MYQCNAAGRDYSTDAEAIDPFTDLVNILQMSQYGHMTDSKQQCHTPYVLKTSKTKLLEWEVE